ncbi:hypothetical protein D9756_005675 [Leucocoprinus leucothites]|uniref:Calpain catalytic domain-containing protein n=1 Tax=Leucocoprinus leucothites TaxID=201217 RepID=A0A8H5D7V9_9AGAR|nr:hypothetical protein D9756_005675 [Leucoagaricus leucothites]
MLTSTPSSPDARSAETIYTKATKAELARNYDEAFKLYIQATESYLHLSRTTHHSESLRTKWKASAGKALERAEKIKAYAQRTQVDAAAVRDGPGSPSGLGGGGGGSAGAAIVRLTPIGINHFSSQEQYYVLKRGSLINGLNFPLWDDPSSSTKNPDSQPPLSVEQQRVSAVWLRPAQAGSSSDISGSRKIHPQEILQHIVTDCSVCASISVCLEHARRFGSELARSALHTASGLAVSLEDKTIALSLTQDTRDEESGRYNVKMFVNGAWRRIGIDDALPYNSSDGSLMCMTIYSQDDKPTVYWPSLIEKSYMKLMGGYDFPGSNSSIDLHAITGWIPDQIDTKSPTFERERTWERLISGFTEGRCLVTLGTGSRSGMHWRGTPLLSAHSYAVIDIDENEEDRVFTVLDSWVRPEDEQHSRVLQIPWSEVLYVFDGIYLSWDPMWKRGSSEAEVDANHNLHVNFVNVNSESDEEIWILLTRHLLSTHRTHDFICLRAQVGNPALPVSTRMNQLHEVSNAGTYTNSSHFLVRTRIPAATRSGVVAVVASYEGEKEAKEIGFTVSVFSRVNVKVAWDESASPPPYSTRVEGVLTSKNSGGNCTYPSFMVNPQYHLRIHPSTKAGGTKKSKTKVVLRALRDVPVNVVVVWSKGDRKDELVEQEVAVSSGAYTYGLAQVTKDLMPGDYTLIASSFEPTHTGPFTIKVECSTPFDLKSIPQEGAGMYTKIIKGAWDANSLSAGAPQFQRYAENPRYELVVPSSGQIKIRLQLIGKAKASPVTLNVALFNAPTSNTTTTTSGTPVATSGTYSETLAGVVTPLVTLAKGRYEIVPSTYMPGVQVEFRLIVYCSVGSFEVKKVQ